MGGIEQSKPEQSSTRTPKREKYTDYTQDERSKLSTDIRHNQANNIELTEEQKRFKDLSEEFWREKNDQTYGIH